LGAQPEDGSISEAKTCYGFKRFNYLLIDTAIFSWRWARGCPKHVEKRNK